MTVAQLYLAIGLPTLAVLVGILTNTMLFQSLHARLNQIDGRFQTVDARFQSMEGRIQNLEAKFDVRFDMLMSKLIDVDNRLTRLEEHRG